MNPKPSGVMLPLGSLVAALIFSALSGVAGRAPNASAMELGGNFWNIGWHKPGDCFVDGQKVQGDNPWNPQFLKDIAIYKSLRFMDWDNANNSGRSRWAERNRKENPKQNPVAYEWMIDLCNRMNADLWLTLPHKTVNRNTGDQPCDYALRLCLLVKTGVDMKEVDLQPLLDRLAKMTAEELVAAGGQKTCEPLKPNLKLYVEYSNETWNGVFQQSHYCCDEGTALDLDKNRWTAGFRFHAWAAVRLFRAANLVFGVDSKRLVRVLATHTANSWIAGQHLEVVKNPKYNPWQVKADAIATAPYFGHDVQGDAPDAVARMRQAIRRSADESAKHKKLADAAGLALIAYEGGQHCTRRAVVLNRNPAMHDLYAEYLAEMARYFTVFSHYCHVGQWGDGGAWGAMEFTGQPLEQAHKYRALVEFAKGEAVEPRPREGSATEAIPSPAGEAFKAPTQAGQAVKRPASNTGTGFFVVTNKVYDANGHEFLVGGFNHTHWWGNNANNFAAIAEFPKTKANCVRAVFASGMGADTPAKQRDVIREYIRNRIVPMVECHNATSGNSAAQLANCVNWWLEPGRVAYLKEFERYVILNIANEWGPDNADVWVKAYQDGIARLRAAGIKNLLVVDAGGNSGQNPLHLISSGREILDADPERNVLFSIHMYGFWRNPGDKLVGAWNRSRKDAPPWDMKVQLEALAATGLPLIIGEWSWQGARDVGYTSRTALALYHQMGLGWLAWSWNQNSNPAMDMMADQNGWRYNTENDLSEWGKLVVDDPEYGMKATARPATIWETTPPPGSEKEAPEVAPEKKPPASKAGAGKPIPPLPESVTKWFGTNIPKTLEKLASGQEVRVVFFGQSLTDGNNLWTHNLCDWLNKAYPKAKVVYVQRSLAGHASEALGPKVQAQLGGQNPTIVIFQDFANSPESYETVVKNMKAAAPEAEFLVWSTHVMQDMPKAREWFERWEGNLLPQMCEKYKLGFLNVYMASRTYLKANYGDEWKWSQICADGVHLNPEGQYLLLELMQLYLKPRDAAAPSAGSAPVPRPHASDVPSKILVPPAPADVSPAPDYRVQVAGREVFVYDTPVGAIALFSLQGEAPVRITPTCDPQRVDVRPLKLRLAPVVKNGAIELKLTGPCNLSVEFNRDIKRPLFVFASLLQINAPPAGAPGVRYFEGGKVHEPGLIEMKDGEKIYLAPGAVVRGAIRARNARNIRIAGPGILDGGRNRELLRGQRSRFIDLQDCEEVSIEDITLINSLTWQIVPTACRNVAIRNVKIVSGNNSDDGIDVVRSRDVTIAGCFIRTKDDCIAVKTIADLPSRIGTEKLVVTNNVFWNAEWGNALEIGFELRNSHVRDILFRDCDVIRVERGATFSIHNGDSATVSNVCFEDIRVEDSRDKLVDLAIFVSQYSVNRPAELQPPYNFDRRWDGVLTLTPEQRLEQAKFRGHIRDIVFKDIQVVGGSQPHSIIHGWDAEHSVENITFDGLWIHGKKITSAEEGKFTLENTKKVIFK